jgi:hypothetical protein
VGTGEEEEQLEPRRLRRRGVVGGEELVRVLS